jgi:hypothetical protein
MIRRIMAAFLVAFAFTAMLFAATANGIGLPRQIEMRTATGPTSVPGQIGDHKYMCPSACPDVNAMYPPYCYLTVCIANP